MFDSLSNKPCTASSACCLLTHMSIQLFAFFEVVINVYNRPQRSQPSFEFIELVGAMVSQHVGPAIKKVIWKNRRNRNRSAMNVINSPIPPDQDWKVKARQYQQNQHNSLGDRYWDIVPDNLLDKKIGFALYGLPTQMKDSDLSYAEEKTNHINRLKNHIISLREANFMNETYLACIFIYVHKEECDDIAVVFRFLRALNENFDDYLFVDSCCRTYKNWNDYLKNNELPKCMMCFPINGFYTSCNDFVEVGFCKSPASKVGRKVLSGLDITSSFLGIGATGVTLASLAIPIAAPFVLGATATVLVSGAYDLGRGVERLVDIGVHKESLSLKNPKSRNVWLNVVTSTVGMASVGITRGLSIMRTGQAITRGEAVALRIINLSSFALSGISGVNTLITVVVKFLDGTLEKADLLQFSSACYFFLNALLSIDLANRLIEEIAFSDDVSNLFFSTNNTFFSVVKSVSHFFDSNTYEILRKLVLGKVIQSFMPDMHLSDLQMIEKRIVLIFDAYLSKKDWNKVAIEMISLSEFIWSKFGKEISNAIYKLQLLFDVEDWKSVFATRDQNQFLDSNLDIARQLCLASQKAINHCLGKDADDSAMKDILILVRVLNSKCPADTTIDYLNLIKFVCEAVEKEFNDIMSKYLYLLDEARSDANNFDESAFNKNYGIEENKGIREHFLVTAVERLLTMERVNKMKDDYSEIFNLCEHPRIGIPSMETSNSYHYMFCEPLGQLSFDDNHYWRKLNDIAGLHYNSENATMLKQNGIILIHPKEENTDIKAMLFYSIKENDCLMGILTVIKNIT